ncbi:MAG: ABC transporter substrate-binding protein [Bacteroidales bacterium]
MKLCLRILIAFLIIITSCKPTGNNPVGSVFTIKVTDFRNKEIILDKPATRIICLIESALSGLYMLQAESKVIGVPSAVYNESVAGQYAALDDRIKNKQLPAPGNWDFVSIESIVALQPDLVIIWASQTEAIQSIEEHGIPVYGVFIKSFDDVYKEIRDFGLLTGKNQRADSLINYTQSEISIIRQKSKNSHPKFVYFMWSQGLLETSGTTSTVNELIELAGAKNSCILAQEHVVINKETLLDWNPDLIVMWYNSNLNPENLIMLPKLKQINAIQNKQVYEFPSVFMCDLWTLKFPYAVKMLAKWCYPSTFAILNLDEEKRKMLIELYGQRGNNLLIF